MKAAHLIRFTFAAAWFMLFAPLLLTGCALGGVSARQTAGHVRAAGVEMVGPVNAAAPSTVTTRRVITTTAPDAAGSGAPSAITTTEETTTATIGQHQDAAAILGAVAAATKWSWLRWVGVACILGGAVGWLWSVGNPLGFPMVFAGVAACGVVFLFAATSPAWLLILTLPAAFYAAQEFGLFRVLDARPGADKPA